MKNYAKFRSALTGKVMYASMDDVIAMHRDTIYGYDASKGETKEDFHYVECLVLVYAGNYSVFVHAEDAHRIMEELHQQGNPYNWF